MYKIITGADSADVALMSRFITGHKNSHFLQSPQWAQVKKTWKWRGILSLDGSGQIIGAVSLLIRPLPLGLSLLYAPRGPVCDREDGAVMAELLEGVRDVAQKFRAISFLMDPDVPAGEEGFRAIMGDAGFSEITSTGLDNIQAQYVMRLNTAGRTEEELFSRFCSKTRYNIRLAQRRGVEIKRFSGSDTVSEEAVAAFSRLMKITGERDRFLTRSPDYFRSILTSLGKDAVLFLAYLDGQPIAGTIGIYHGHKAWYLYGASSNQHREVMPNYLLQWEMIRLAVSLKCTFYDFRGVPGELSADHPLYGLYRFKKGFSGDYVKFSGLYVYKYKKLPATVFWLAFRAYRKLLRRQTESTHPRPYPLSSPAAVPVLTKQGA